MRRGKMIIGLAVILVLAVAGTASASIVMEGTSQRADETLLEGDVLDQVVAAAVTEVGEDATVVRAEVDADGNAAYEVHIVLADGTPVTVYVDESYEVVEVVQQPAKGTCAEDKTAQPWGEERTNERANESPLEGEVLAAVLEAAIAEVDTDATVIRAETDADGNAAYEVHMVLADGTPVTVYVDESYSVVSVEEKQAGEFHERERDRKRLLDLEGQREHLRSHESRRDRDGTQERDGDRPMEQGQTWTQFQGDRQRDGMSERRDGGSPDYGHGDGSRGDTGTGGGIHRH